MDVELKPCPFCNGEAGIQVTHSDYRGIYDESGYYVLCQNLECNAEGTWDLGVSGAAEHWNTRPLEDDLQTMVGSLQITITALKHDHKVEAERQAAEIDRLRLGLSALADSPFKLDRLLAQAILDGMDMSALNEGGGE